MRFAAGHSSQQHLWRMSSPRACQLSQSSCTSLYPLPHFMQGPYKAVLLDQVFVQRLSQSEESALAQLQGDKDAGGTQCVRIFLVDPTVAAAALANKLALPDDVTAACEAACGMCKGVRPHNAILEQWRFEGLSYDVQWKDAAHMLQKVADAPVKV